MYMHVCASSHSISSVSSANGECVCLKEDSSIIYIVLIISTRLSATIFMCPSARFVTHQQFAYCTIGFFEGSNFRGRAVCKDFADGRCALAPPTRPMWQWHHNRTCSNRTRVGVGKLRCIARRLEVA